jgi:hypothetical protein
MPLSFPCPNPACTQVFSPQDLRGVTSLTCPKCGTVFQFRSDVPAAPPARPAAIPVGIPVRRKVRPAAPQAVPGASPVAVDLPAARRAAPKPGRAAGKRGWLLLPVGLCLLLVTLGVAAWSLRDRWTGGETAEGSARVVQSRAMNYRFQAPRGPWTQDKAVERELGASFAMRRTDPNSWFAVVVRDYKERMPRDDELLREAVGRLNRFFKRGAEWVQRDEDAFAGLPAQRLVFSAESGSNVPVCGECLMTAHAGLAYWFFGWTPAATDEAVLAGVQQEWRQVREGFTLLKEREGWTGKVPEVVTAEGRKVRYRLKYTKGLWENDDNPAGADLLLHGRDPEHSEDARRWAWVRVFLRPAAADAEAALADARAFVQQREKALYPETTMDPVPEAGKGGLPDGAVELGQAGTRVMRLRVKKAEDYEYFFAIAAVPRPTATLVLVCECAWSQREAWEDRFGPVLHSLQFDKK